MNSGLSPVKIRGIWLLCLLTERIVHHGTFVPLDLRLRATAGHDRAWESVTETATVLVRAARTCVPRSSQGYRRNSSKPSGSQWENMEGIS